MGLEHDGISDKDPRAILEGWHQILEDDDGTRLPSIENGRALWHVETCRKAPNLVQKGWSGVLKC